MLPWLKHISALKIPRSEHDGGYIGFIFCGSMMLHRYLMCEIYKMYLLVPILASKVFKRTANSFLESARADASKNLLEYRNTFSTCANVKSAITVVKLKWELCSIAKAAIFHQKNIDLLIPLTRALCQESYLRMQLLRGNQHILRVFTFGLE